MKFHTKTIAVLGTRFERGARPCDARLIESTIEFRFYCGAFDVDKANVIQGTALDEARPYLSLITSGTRMAPYIAANRAGIFLGIRCDGVSTPDREKVEAMAKANNIRVGVFSH